MQKPYSATAFVRNEQKTMQFGVKTVFCFEECRRESNLNGLTALLDRH